MNRKGQSAIEYLTTYGWMLITVSIVSGVAYSSFGTACVESSSGFVGESVQIQDFGLTTGSELAIALENRRSDNVEIQEVVIENSSIAVTDGDLDPGGVSSVTVTGFEESSGCNSFDIELVYSIEGLDDQSATGTVTGPFSVGGEAPIAPDNLFVDYSG
ncbi:MAG: hypothetical protein R6V35_02930 [Candidatus Nanohaloarchaea archaeon]